jgi:hypothetical protein
MEREGGMTTITEANVTEMWVASLVLDQRTSDVLFVCTIVRKPSQGERQKQIIGCPFFPSKVELTVLRPNRVFGFDWDWDWICDLI